LLDGVIVDGGAVASLFDNQTIGSDTIRKAMRDITADDSIKCVVIRINSPGGSALASEAMWQAVRRVAVKKPVVISIGNMAASGGYYLASAGDRIFADSSAIVGSIGVVGGKFVTKDLFDKLGITTQSFLRGNNAGLFGSDAPFTDRQRKMSQKLDDRNLRSIHPARDDHSRRQDQKDRRCRPRPGVHRSAGEGSGHGG